MVKTITDDSGRKMKLGRIRPQERPKLCMESFKTTVPLPAAPDCNYVTGSMNALRRLYLNDELGDCVIACAAHMFGVFNENAGAMPSIFSDSEVKNAYSLFCGFDPNNPSGTDNGCDEQQVLNGLKTHGLKGHKNPNGDGPEPVMHKIQGWLGVNGASVEEVRQAVYLFENLVFGMELPDKWISPFPSAPDFVWDLAGAPDPNNGHCVLGVGSNSEGIQICSWGLVGTITYAAIAEYTAFKNGGELYVAVSKEALNRAQQKAPNGLNWDQLMADFNSLGGHL